MIASIALAAIYILVLGGFGYITSRYWLRLTEPLAIGGMTFVAGTVSFLLMSNGLGYFIPIHVGFWVALSALFCLSAFSVISGNRPPPIDRHTLPTLTILLVLIVFVGIMNARFHGSDPWSWQHFPMASTIVDGNFPVMSPIDPLRPLRYHYAPAFLAAGFRVITGLPLTVGFALQPLVGAAGILLFAGSVAASLTRSRRTILLAAIFSLMGAGLEWMKIWVLVSDLFHHYVLHENVGAPFKALAPLYSGTLTTSLLTFLGHRSLATGYPLVYGFLFAATSLYASARECALRWYAVIFVIILGLTLTMELGFVTLWCGCVTFAVLMFVLGQHLLCRRAVMLSAVVFPVACFIALFHGGVLSGLGGGESSFELFFNGKVFWKPDVEVAFYEWEFFRSFGLPLILFPFSLAYAWKARRSAPVLALVAIVAGGHLIIPFLVRYLNIPGEMHRVFFGFSTLAAFLLALVIGEEWLTSHKRLVHWMGYVVVPSVIMSAVIYSIVRITIPDMRFHASPLFLPMPPVSAERQAMYAWVRAHTTPQDFFYVRNLTVDFRTVSDEEAQMRDRILFTTYTGRFTVGPIIYWNYDAEWLLNVLHAETTCNPDAMRFLKIRYLLVEDSGRAQWFTQHCRTSLWQLRYGSEAADAFPRVYELQAS